MQHWSAVNHHEGDPRPVGRSRHAAVCLGYGRYRPQLLITGGKDAKNRALSDAWMLDVHSGRWKEVSM
jgi:hypothetical protein